MTWLLGYLPLLKKFGPFILAGMVVLGVYMAGRSHGKAKWYPRYQKELEAKRDALEREKRLSSELEGVRRGLALCTERTADWKADAAAKISRLEDELEKTPDSVVRYRDKIVEVPNEITSDQCEEALAQAADFLRVAC